MAIPHFALPFTLGDDGHALTNEQDGLDDVAECVEACLRTRPGQRDELPAYGTNEAVFHLLPLSTERIAAAVSIWEPRARVLVTDAPDALDETVRRVRVNVYGEE